MITKHYYICSLNALQHLYNKRYMPVYYYRFYGTLFIDYGTDGDNNSYVLLENLTNEELMLLTLTCNTIDKINTDMFSCHLIDVIINEIGVGNIDWLYNMPETSYYD